MCAQAQLGAYGSADKAFVTSAGHHNHPTATQVGFGRSALQDRASESAGPASPCQACVGGRVRYHDVWIVSLPVSRRARRLVPPPRWALVAWQTKLGERKKKAALRAPASLAWTANSRPRGAQNSTQLGVRTADDRRTSLRQVVIFLFSWNISFGRVSDAI